MRALDYSPINLVPDMDPGQPLMTDLLKSQWGNRRLVLEVPPLMDFSQPKPVYRNLELDPQYSATVSSRGPIPKSIVRSQEFFVDTIGYLDFCLII